VGDPVTIKWQVTGGSCPAKSNCPISLEGVDVFGMSLVTKKSGLPSTGATTVKVHEDTHFILTAGSQNKALWVTVYAVPGGSPMTDPCQTAGKCQFFYFKIVNPSSPCYTDATFAPDAKSAKSYLQNQNIDATITQITEAEYLAGCS
jgi:hypothetical protein